MKPGVPSAEPGRRRGHLRQRGFALLIMLVLAVMGSLFAVTGQLEFVTRKYARNDATFKALTLAKEALIGYAMTYRDNSGSEVFGYLPCPDIATGDGAAAGNCGTAGQAAIGLFPYKTLGLPDLRDSDGVCLWYAVSGNFKNNPKAINTSPAPDPLVLMNWDTQGQFIMAGTPVAPEQGDGGAAAVIFAAGKPLAGQSRSVSGSSACQIDLNQVTAYLDGNYTFATANAITITPGASDSTTNNDQLVWITPKEIFDKVVKRQDFSNALTASPPGQINALTDIIQSVLEKKIQDDLIANTTSASQPLITGFTQFGKQIGMLPTAAASLQATPLYDNYTANKIDYSYYYDNWRDQYRLATCSSLTTPCLTVGGTLCRGALMFAGRTATANGFSVAGQPRTSAQKLYDPSPLGTDNLASYFEAASGLELLNSPTTAFSGSSAYSAASPSLDLGTCLFPGTFLSSAQDIAGFSGGVVNPSATSPVASVTAGATPSINLGSATTVARSGCVWYQTPFALGSTLRLYFNFVIVTAGQGFTLALADAATNNVASTDPYMCGSTAGSRLGYAGTPTGGSSAGIKPPKIGIEFDLATTANRNDYSADHFGFLYWGSTGDNNSTGNGNNDNTHYYGILGSGSEPLSPRDLSVTTASATPIATLSEATWAGGTVAATSAAPHGFTTGQYVLIADATSATAFDPASSTPVAVTVTDATHFTYPLASDPGAYTYGTTASRTAKTTSSGVTCSGGTATATTSTNHDFSANQWINVSGITPVGYNGTYQIASIVSATRFTYALGVACPSTSSVAGFVTATNDIVSASWSSGTVTATTGASHGLGRQITGAAWSSVSNTTTVTTSANHDFFVGQTVSVVGISPATYDGSRLIVAVTANSFTFDQTSDPGSYVSGGWVSAGDRISISGIYPAGYNGTYPVTVTSATQFTYTLASNPGSSFNNTAFATSGFSTVKSPYFPAGGAMPTSPDIIHVRLDLTRSYSASAHQATFTLKAYIDNLFPVASVCSDTDFKNLARDLSSWCPLRTPTIQQDNVVINDVSAPAMANIYIGFTTARGTSSSDNQDISIYDVLLRSQ